MSDAYHVYIALTEQRDIKYVAPVTMDEAEVGISILSQTHEQRIVSAQELAGCVIRIQNMTLVDRAKMRITVHARTIDGLRAELGQIYYRTAQLFGMICMKDKCGIDWAIHDLKRIKTGLVPHGSTLKPFLVADGFVPADGIFF